MPKPVTPKNLMATAYDTINHPNLGPTHAFTIPLLGQLAIAEAIRELTAELKAIGDTGNSRLAAFAEALASREAL